MILAGALAGRRAVWVRLAVQVQVAAAWGGAAVDNDTHNDSEKPGSEDSKQNKDSESFSEKLLKYWHSSNEEEAPPSTIVPAKQWNLGWEGWGAWESWGAEGSPETSDSLSDWLGNFEALGRWEASVLWDIFGDKWESTESGNRTDARVVKDLSFLKERLVS
jgi:hypothetical protein